MRHDPRHDVYPTLHAVTKALRIQVFEEAGDCTSGTERVVLLMETSCELDLFCRPSTATLSLSLSLYIYIYIYIHIYIYIYIYRSRSFSFVLRTSGTERVVWLMETSCELDLFCRPSTATAYLLHPNSHIFSSSLLLSSLELSDTQSL